MQTSTTTTRPLRDLGCSQFATFDVTTWVRRRTGGAMDAPDLETQALSGDERAWNALIHRYDRRVFVSLLAKGVRPDLARDLTQETWIKLIEQQRSGKLTELRLPGLAVVQADFLWRSERRRRGLPTVEPVEEDERPLEIPDPAVSPERKLHDRRQLDAALSALEECSPRQREIFLAVQTEGLSASEASDRFGISVQRARQTLWEVRKRLKAVMEGA